MLGNATLFNCLIRSCTGDASALSTKLSPGLSVNNVHGQPCPSYLSTEHPNSVTPAQGKKMICETITLSVQSEVMVYAGH